MQRTVTELGQHALLIGKKANAYFTFSMNGATISLARVADSIPVIERKLGTAFSYVAGANMRVRPAAYVNLLVAGVRFVAGRVPGMPNSR